MTQEKTHWKKLVNTDYLGTHSLPPEQDMILTIDKIVREIVKGPGGKKDECTVCYWKEKGQKPMILNRVNQKTITSIYATPYIEDWLGKKVQLFSAQVKAFDELVDALRIRPFVPKTEKEALLLGTPAYEKAVTYIQGGGKLSNIEDKYSLTKEVKESLQKHVPAQS